MLSKVDRQTGDLTTVAGTSSDAIQVEYNNTSSGLAAGNVQSAIDEVNGKTQFCKSITNDTGSDIWCKLYAPITSVLDTDSLTFTLTAGKCEEYKLELSDVAGTSQSMHPMGAGVKRVADAWNQTGQDYAGFAIDKFVWYDNGYYIHVIHNTTVRVTQLTGTGDILPFEFTISEAPAAGAYVISVNEMPPSFDYMDRVRNSNWAKMGEKYNWDPGFLRQGRIPRKVVVIGNSMTYHGPASYWEVNDLREMAASTPTSGWVSLVYRELKKLNPNIEMYKANGATWETATLGSRAYSDLSANLVAKMTDTGCEATTLTINDVLTSDVDIVICQLYENIGDPGTAGITDLIVDYMNLYDTFREKCPKAFLYQFAGFWQTWNKHQAVVRASAAKSVECIYAFTLNPINTGLSSNMSSNSHSLYEAQAGDKIYDGAGTEITTVTSTVAGHPNDAGFATMAAHVICRLYNAYFGGTADKPTQQFKLDLWGEDSFVTQLDEKEVVDELFFGSAAAGTASDPSNLDDMFKVSHTLYDSVFNFIIFFNGVTAITVNYSSSANHSYIKNQISIEISGYTRFNQTICDSNASYTFERGVYLSATETNPTPWVPARSIFPSIDGMVSYTGEIYAGRLVKRLCIIPNSTVTPNPNNWSTITDDVSSAKFDTLPTEILRLTSGNPKSLDTGVQNVFIKYNIRFRFDDNTGTDVFVAADTEFTWAAGRALWVDYI